jgi:hypothetical protein
MISYIFTYSSGGGAASQGALWPKRVISDFLGCRVQNFPFVPSPRHNQGQALYPCLPVQMGAGSRAILRTLLLTLQSV